MDDIKVGIDRKTYRLKEESMARRRNQQHHKQLFWNDITNYYKSWDVQATKYNLWTSESSTATATATATSDERNERQICRRRNSLSRLLDMEFQQYDQELRLLHSKRSSAKSSVCYSKTFSKEIDNIQFRSKFNDQQRNLNDDDGDDGDDGGGDAHVHSSRNSKNSPDTLVRVNKKRYQDSMKECWNEQMKEKQLQKEYERKLALELEEEIAVKRQLEEEEQRQTILRKKKEMKELQSHLLSQIEEVKKRDLLTQEIKLNERHDIHLKKELEEMAVRRNAIEKQRRSKELFSFLRHQYQTQLKQKTKRVQQELMEDKRFVDELCSRLEEQESRNSWVREQARKEIDRANAVLSEYYRLEKQREKEMEFLFFEEAKKLWHKQETRWNVELEARNNLMRDVLVTIQKQIKDKLETNAQTHAKLIEEKEQLLKDIENINARLKEDNQQMKENQLKYRQDLDAQVKEKVYSDKL